LLLKAEGAALLSRHLFRNRRPVYLAVNLFMSVNLWVLWLEKQGFDLWKHRLREFELVREC